MTQGHRGVIDDYRIISYDNKLRKNCGITHCRGVIYYYNNFIIQATAVPMRLFHPLNRLLYNFVHPFLKVIKTAYHDIGHLTLFFTAIETRGQCYKTNTVVIYCHFRLNYRRNIYNIKFTLE
jgi:hypothetical protein